MWAVRTSLCEQPGNKWHNNQGFPTLRKCWVFATYYKHGTGSIRKLSLPLVEVGRTVARIFYAITFFLSRDFVFKVKRSSGISLYPFTRLNLLSIRRRAATAHLCTMSPPRQRLTRPVIVRVTEKQDSIGLVVERVFLNSPVTPSL